MLMASRADLPARAHAANLARKPGGVLAALCGTMPQATPYTEPPTVALPLA